jgi:hypothetical protein
MVGPRTFKTLVVVAGLGQLALAVGSLAIPRVLGWREELARVRPLTRQVFWTYAAYIWCTNLAFGLLTALAPESLWEGRLLTVAVTAFIALYWGARVAVQFLYFDRTGLPSGRWGRLGEAALIGLFLYLTGIYGFLALANFMEFALGGMGP